MSMNQDRKNTKIKKLQEKVRQLHLGKNKSECQMKKLYNKDLAK